MCETPILKRKYVFLCMLACSHLWGSSTCFLWPQLIHHLNVPSLFVHPIPWGLQGCFELGDHVELAAMSTRLPCTCCVRADLHWWWSWVCFRIHHTVSWRGHVSLHPSAACGENYCSAHCQHLQLSRFCFSQSVDRGTVSCYLLPAGSVVSRQATGLYGSLQALCMHHSAKCSQLSSQFSFCVLSPALTRLKGF